MRERVLATVCACKWHAAHWVLSKSHWQWEQSVDKPEKYSSVAGSFSDQCSARHGFRQRIWSAKQGTAQMQLFNTHIATSKRDSTCRTSSQSLSTARRKKKDAADKHDSVSSKFRPVSCYNPLHAPHPLHFGHSISISVACSSRHEDHYHYHVVSVMDRIYRAKEGCAMGQACQRGGPGSILYHVRCVPDTLALGQVCAEHTDTWIDLCRTQWHWDRFLSDYVDCPPSGSLQQCTILIYICIFMLTLARRTSGWSRGTFKQGAILSDTGQLRAAPGSTVTLILDEGNVTANWLGTRRRSNLYQTYLHHKDKRVHPETLQKRC